MPNSMTGFGAGEGAVAGRRLRIEVRTVNHRFFNPAFKLPGDLTLFEGEFRQRLRRELDRGHIAVVLEEDPDAEPPEDGLDMEVLNPAYNDYVILAGWEADE